MQTCPSCGHQNPPDGDHAAAVRQAGRAASFYRGKGATVPLERAVRLAEAIGSEGGAAPA